MWTRLDQALGRARGARPAAKEPSIRPKMKPQKVVVAFEDVMRCIIFQFNHLLLQTATSIIVSSAQLVLNNKLI